MSCGHWDEDRHRHDCPNCWRRWLNRTLAELTDDQLAELLRRLP